MDDNTNPHHTSAQAALDPGCTWGIPATLLKEFAQGQGAGLPELKGVQVGAPVNRPSGIVRQLSLEVEHGEDREFLVIDVPYVLPGGWIIFGGRDVAPVGFLRLRPGTYKVGDGDSFVVEDPLSPETENHVDNEDPFVVDDPMSPETENHVTTVSTWAELHGDLANCRVLLAGHHLAAVVREAAPLIVRAVAETPKWANKKATDEANGDEADVEWSLYRRVRRAETIINGRLKQLVLGGRPDPDGGLHPFETLDDTNPLARFEQCRKISRLGPGGVGTRGTLSEALRDVHPSHLGRLCPLNTPESERVGLVRYLTLRAPLDENGYFEEIGDPAELEPEDLLSASALLLPLLNHDDAVRGVLATKSLRQFVPLAEPELPIVRTGYENTVSARLGASHRADQQSQIAVFGGVIRERAGGVTSEWPLRNHPDQPPQTGIDGSRLMCVNGIPERPVPARGVEPNEQTVKRGALIWRSPGTLVENDQVVIAPGVNATCVVMPFRGLTIEDAVVVSESLAERMRSVHIESISERLHPAERFVPVTGTGFLDQFVGTTIDQGQDLGSVYAIHDPSRDDPGHVEATADAGLRRTVVSPFTGQVIHTEVHRHPSGERVVRLLVRVERELEVGDKLTSRHGNKGVVAAVVADDEMPVVITDDAEVPADVVISPFGPLRRMVVGLFHELAWSIVSRATGKTVERPPIGNSGVADITSKLTELERTTSARVRLPAGNSGDSTELEDVAWGTLYVVKLNHLAARKLQSQSWSPGSPMTGQPSRTRFDEQGRRMGRPQRLGEMEFWALQSYGAYDVISDALGGRRGSTSRVSQSLRAVLDHLHAVGICADLHTQSGKVVDSLDANAVSQISDRVTSVDFHLMERRRRSEGTNGASQPPTWGEKQTVESPINRAERERVTADREAPRPKDGRRDRTEREGTDEPAARPPAVPTETVCACPTSSEQPPGTLCDRCKRVRRVVVAGSEHHKLEWIDLGLPVAHPWYLEEFREAVVTLAQDDEATRSILDRECVEPGGAIAWSDAQVVGVVRRLLEIVETDPAAASGCESAETALGFTLRYLPLLPAAHRRRFPASDGRLVDHPLTKRYERVGGLAVELTSKLEENPPVDVTETYGRLANETRWIFGRATGTSAGVDTLAHRLRFKEGLLRRYLLGSSQWRTAYAVIVPDHNLLPNEIGLPSSVRADLKVEAGDTVLVNRNPTLRRTEMLGMKVVDSPDSTTHIPPTVIPMLACDFDGDTVTVHSPLTEEARGELETTMHPARNLVDPGTGDPLVYCGEELAIDPNCGRELEEAAHHLHASSTLFNARGLREVYQQWFTSLTGRGSISLTQLVERANHQDVLSEVASGGFKSKQQEQVFTRVGSAPTYATRRLGQEQVTIEGNFLHGLSNDELVANARAAMVKLGDKKLATPKAGDFMKKLIEALYDVTVVEGDCQTKDRVELHQLSVRADRREAGPTDHVVRSPLCCEWLASDPTTVCQACYGPDLTTGELAVPGLRVGLLAAQSIGQPGTQLALKSIHAGAQRTELETVLAPLSNTAEHEVPTVDANGQLTMDLQSPTTSTLSQDPLAIVGLFRWVYTVDADKTRGVARNEKPVVDDIHFELAMASLSSSQRLAGGDVSALGAAARRLDPLARATQRGNLKPILEAAASDSTKDYVGWRSRFVLHPTDLKDPLP